jgi:hypothetical protein
LSQAAVSRTLKTIEVNPTSEVQQQVLGYYEGVSETEHHPISIPPDIAAKCHGPEQFQNFDPIFRALTAAPEAAVDKPEAKWKRGQFKKRARRSR